MHNRLCAPVAGLRVGSWHFSEVPASATEGSSSLQSGLRQAAGGVFMSSRPSHVNLKFAA